jgi:tetratricopeptide (TPR) repeat protein
MGSLPTQAPTPTPLQADYFLERLKIALLSGDYDEATRLWDIVSTRFPENSEVQREGARLALVQEDLDTAKAQAWTAVHIAPKEAANWLIVGVVEQRRGAPKVAQQALEMAQSFDPELAPDLFAARWQAALASEDRDNLTALAQEYIMQNPQDPLSLYYRAESLLTSGAADSALDLHLLSMDQESRAHVVRAGRVYMAKRADKHAVTALEVAAAGLCKRGQQSASGKF